MKLLWMTIVVLLTGCAIHQPKDLRFETVSLVTYNNAPYTIPGLKNMPSLRVEQIELLKIDVSSVIDLIRFAKAHSVNVGKFANLCDNKTPIWPSDHISAGNIDLYNAMYSKVLDLHASRRPDGRIRYQIFVPLNGAVMASFHKPTGPGSRHAWLYDVDAHAGDLCVGFRGGGMQGTSFKSNMAAVPRARILEALERRAHAGLTPERTD